MTHTSSKTGKDYFLHRTPTQKPGSFLYYFSSKKNESCFCEEIPMGHHVVESDNGFPILRKTKTGQ